MRPIDSPTLYCYTIRPWLRVHPRHRPFVVLLGLGLLQLLPFSRQQHLALGGRRDGDAAVLGGNSKEKLWLVIPF